MALLSKRFCHIRGGEINMRFCDFFIAYKIGLKQIKSTIPFMKLPSYRKVFVILVFAFGIASGIFLIVKKIWISLSLFAIVILLFVVFFIMESSKKNLELMLKEHYEPYSQKRINMIINLLGEYEIDIYDSSSIDLLIEEARTAQIQSDYIEPLKKPLKILAGIIIPIVVFVAEKIGNSATQDEMIFMALQAIILIILIFSLIISLTPLFKDILYRDFKKYEELIYDLRQIKLFKTKK